MTLVTMDMYLIEQMGYQIVSTENMILCSKIGFETEFFELKLIENRYYVSVPLKNSVYQYKTSFLQYDEAICYMNHKFKDYCDLL